MCYVIKIWGFLTPLPFLITFSTERNQKLPFYDPPPPAPFCDYVVHGCSLKFIIKHILGRQSLSMFGILFVFEHALETSNVSEGIIRTV